MASTPPKITRLTLMHDIVAVLETQKMRLLNLRKGRVIIAVQDSRLVTFTIEEELRVGHELSRPNSAN